MEAKEECTSRAERQEAVKNAQESPGLRVSDFSQLIEEKKASHFPGTREWLFNIVREWVQHPSKRLFWLAGGAGTGKSVMSAKLLDTEGVREHIVAWHFCRHDNVAGSDIRVMLQSWAAMLSANLPGFHVQPQEVVKAMTGGVEDMFQLLLVTPLKRMAPPSSPKLILLDALDELTADSLNSVLYLIHDVFNTLPSFVRLFVTSRNLREIRIKLNAFEQEKLEVSEVRNRADLRIYLSEVARRHINLELTAADIEAKMEQQFGLAPQSLQGKLSNVESLMRKSKAIYESVVEKLKVEASYKEVLGATDIYPTQSPAQQMEGDLERLYDEATEAREQMLNLFASEWQEWKRVDHGRTVLRVPVEGKQANWVDNVIDPGLKSLESAQRKVLDVYKGDARLMKDLVRFTAECESSTRMATMLRSLRSQSQLEIVGLRNKYSSPTPLGYRDFNLTLRVRLSNNRVHLCELQVNVRDMLQAKELAHELYEGVRAEIPSICRGVGVSDADKFEQSLTRVLRSSVLDVAVGEMEQKAGGLFLYATLLARELERQPKLEFSQLKILPSGLGDIYQGNFDRMVGSNKADWPAYRGVIAFIAAARQPLPATFVRQIMGPASERMEQALSLLFPVHEGVFQVMHKSVVDWLTDSERKVQDYSISSQDISAAHKTLAPELLEWCDSQSLQPPQSADTSFAISEVLFHLCGARMFAEACDLITKNLQWLLARAALSPSALVADVGHFAEFGSVHRTTAKLIASGLSLALPAIQMDWHTLPAQLVGHLVGFRNRDAGVTVLLQTLLEWNGPNGQGWWCPTTQSLQPAGGPLLHEFRQTDVAKSVDWSPDCKSLATSCDQFILVWDVRSGRCIQTLKGHTDATNSVSWSRDGSRLCSASTDATVRVWDVENDKCIQVLRGHTGSVNSVSWSLDGSRVCSGGDDHEVRVWDVETGKCLFTFAPAGNSGPMSATVVAWSRDGKQVAGSTMRDTIEVWDVESGQRVQKLSKVNCVDALAWSTDGRICSGDSMSLKVWDVETGTCIVLATRVWANSVSWSPDCSRICNNAKDYRHQIHIWDLKTSQCVQTLGGHGPLQAVCWSRDGRICASANDKAIRVWDPSEADNKTPPEGHTKPVNCMSLSGDGKLCSGSEDFSVRIWNIETGKCVKTLSEPNEKAINAVSWSSDGKLCSGTTSTGLQLWDLKAGTRQQLAALFKQHVYALAWSPDGRICCSSGNDVIVWEMEICKVTHRFVGHSEKVTSVSWSADSKRIGSGSADNSLRVWQLNSGECVCTTTHPASVVTISWSSEGKIFSGCTDQKVRVWDVESGTCVYQAETLLGYRGAPFWIECWLAAAPFLSPAQGVPVGERGAWYPVGCPTHPDRAIAARGSTIHFLQHQGVSPTTKQVAQTQRFGCWNCAAPFDVQSNADIPSNVLRDGEASRLESATQDLFVLLEDLFNSRVYEEEEVREEESSRILDIRKRLTEARAQLRNVVKPFNSDPDSAGEFQCQQCHHSFCRNCLENWVQQYRGHCGFCVTAWLTARSHA